MATADVLALIGPGTGDLKKADLAAIGAAITAAEACGGAVDIALLGTNAAAWADGVSQFGARTVFLLTHADLEPFTAEATAAAIQEFLAARPYRFICAATSSANKEYFPRLAALVDAPMASDVVAIDRIDAERAALTRAVFVGNLLADLELQGETCLATCRPSEFRAAPIAESGSPTETVELSGPLLHEAKRSIRVREAKSERPDLKEAQIIVSVGRGTRGPDEGIPLCTELADLLNAAVGASRAVVDAGWLPNDLQVGQTGKIVAPDLYFAIGLSGSIQHLAGMRNAKTIVAINKDPDAPIFEVADLGWVADLFDAVPELTRELRATKEA